MLDPDPAVTAARVRARVPAGASVEGAVREIVAGVRAGGDAAVLDYTRRFDTRGAEPSPLRVPEEELDAALAALDPDVRRGLEVAVANVDAVASATLRDTITVDLPQGQRVVVREMPVQRAAVYVPGGRAPYPSTVVMGVVVARAACVPDVAVCAPPGPDGRAHDVILAACALTGAREVYRMGGAQAIAALAYGTETIPAVDVIVGPGNLYVQEAKRQVYGQVGIEGFQGPSDLLVLFDAAADLRLVALDLLAQAEHGAESFVGAVSSAPMALDGLAFELERLASERADLEPAGCVLVEAPSLAAGLVFAEAYAPEHLELVGAEAEALAPKVSRAGCLFVGANGATAFGDYVAGSNHVLPTGGAARFASGLSPLHFRRRMSEVHIGSAAPALAAAGAPIARAEGFVVHAESMEARVRENPGR